MSAEEAKRKGLNQTRRFDRYMRYPRAPMKCVWQNRRKEAFTKERKRHKDALAAQHRAAPDDVSEESSEEHAASMQKKPLSCDSTT